ncbi:hypothetical protein MSMEG_0584 [Mycolicibacterium smegmatis MC2 155]|uniref:Uncharacterized protein n=1 Tax=Mycolicibacterium smegmatis (strain ATCC 700084 / mc(2)155) TaxID=246196 RepID=A0QQ07_MYCS2|nr:hypothetical protein MSMEG_0584 [Mycolicibacterium smegmatis MC2 155]
MAERPAAPPAPSLTTAVDRTLRPGPRALRQHRRHARDRAETGPLPAGILRNTAKWLSDITSDSGFVCLFSIRRRNPQFSGDRAHVLEFPDSVPVQPQLHEHHLGVLGGLRGARGLQRFMVELHGSAHHAERFAAVGRLDLDDHVVGDGLLVGRQVDQALERRPLSLHGLEVPAPVLERPAADRLGDALGGLCGVLDERQHVAEPRIVGEFGQAEMLESVPDVAGGAHDAQVDGAAVGRLVVPQERVDRGPDRVGHLGTHGLAGLHALRDARARGPPRGGQQGHVDLERLARAVAVEQRRGDPARDVHPADRVAERGDPLRQRAAEFLGCQGVPHTAAGPERGAVEPAGEPLGPLVAVRAAARVDDVRVHRPDVLDVELVLLPGLRHVVGEEDIRHLRQLVEHLLPLGLGHVDADAALAAVGMLDQRMPVGVELEPAHVDEAPLGVAPHRMLNLDHVGAPVGEDRSGRGNERELRDLQHPYTLHDLDQGGP